MHRPTRVTADFLNALKQEIEEGKLVRGSPAAILEVMRRLPPIAPDIVDEMERAIEEGKLPVRDEGIFDDLR